MPFGWEMFIASAIGLVGGYAGIAGAPFIVFLLVTFIGYSQHSAQGTVLAMMLGPMTIFPVILGWHIVRSRLKEIITSVLTYMAFSFAGAQIAYSFSSPGLTLLFGIFIALLGVVYILFSIGQIGVIQHDNKNPPLIYMAIIGAVIGTVGGMTGIGAGILLVPLLTMWLGVEQREAQTMSLAILLPPVSLGAAVKYGFMENDIIWPAAGLMLLTYFITSALGYMFSFRHPTLVIRIVLSALLMLAGILDIVGVIR